MPRPKKEKQNPREVSKDQIEQARIAQRQTDALELRIAGGSYREIGARLGVSAVQAMTDVKNALDLLAERTTELTDQYRTLELERLDQMTVHGFSILNQQGMSYEYRLKAIDRLVKVAAERAKLLGLYKPYKVEHSGTIDFMEFLNEAGDGDTGQ